MQIQDRRTIRKYEKKDIPAPLLTSMLETATRAATMGNMQLYSVVITRDEEEKRILSPLHFNQPMVMDAPVVLTFCADFNRFTEWCKLRDAQPGYDNYLSFLNAASDTLLFVQAFCTLAEEKGLGTCYLGTTIYNAEQIIEALHLPKLTFPIATITVGWPAENPAQSDRLPIEAIIHEGHYQTYDAATINQIYSVKESLEENKHFVEINHKANLAQVFTDCRYTKSDNEAISKSLIHVLEQQGFLHT